MIFFLNPEKLKKKAILTENSIEFLCSLSANIIPIKFAEKLQRNFSPYFFAISAQRWFQL